MAVAGNNVRYSKYVNQIIACRENGKTGQKLSMDISDLLKKHSALDNELKSLNANLRQIDRKKEDLITAARGKIGPDEAQKLIVDRFHGALTEQFGNYLVQYSRSFISAIERLNEKYAITLHDILMQRDRAKNSLNVFLIELGYEQRDL